MLVWLRERVRRRILSGVIAAALYLLGATSSALAFCHERELIQAVPPALSGEGSRTLTIEWFGHSTFLLTSSRGTQILMDPHDREDLPRPAVAPHAVTASHEHTPHSNFAMARGAPRLLPGIVGGEWNRISTSVRDVSLYTVPVYHDKSSGMQRGKNAIFVLSVDGLCVAHLGDLGHLLTEDQLKMLGRIDILLLPIGGGIFTVTPEEARKVAEQVKPKIVIPHHYSFEDHLAQLLTPTDRIRRIPGNRFVVSKETLPASREIVILSYP